MILIALCGIGCVGGPALASDTSNQGTAARRQAMKDCMTKKMSADKTLSYNAATRACSALIKPAANETASNSPIKQ